MVRDCGLADLEPSYDVTDADRRHLRGDELKHLQSSRISQRSKHPDEPLPLIGREARDRNHGSALTALAWRVPISHAVTVSLYIDYYQYKEWHVLRGHAKQLEMEGPRFN
jgi:hypothetical protein